MQSKEGILIPNFKGSIYFDTQKILKTSTRFFLLLLLLFNTANIYAQDADGDGIIDLIECNESAGAYPISTLNAGFELPVHGVTPPTPIVAFTYASNYAQADVLGWSTTATDFTIEIGRTANNTPYAGSQYAEINANLEAALYQDIMTTPGNTVSYSFAHKGRTGTGVGDSMNVLVGPPGGPLSIIEVVGTNNSAWSFHEGTFVVPVGQTVTRVQFEAISTASGDNAIGNFLDAVSFLSCGLDSDGDTVENNSDIDSDNDGISDAIEYGVNISAVDFNVDTDNDGVPDDMDVTNTGGADLNTNGIDDLFDAIDTDGDSVPDFQDLDSDNDGIHDVDEAGHGALDTNNDGTISETESTDSDGNGQVDATEGINPTDTGSNGSYDFQNLDSDGDLCSDANEAYINNNADGGDGSQYGFGTPASVDSDGLVTTASYAGTNSTVTDNSNTFACTTAALDTDGDGVLDSNDLDDDNDGIPDNIECTATINSSSNGGAYANQINWLDFNDTDFADLRANIGDKQTFIGHNGDSLTVEIIAASNPAQLDRATYTGGGFYNNGYFLEALSPVLFNFGTQNYTLSFSLVDSDGNAKDVKIVTTDSEASSAAESTRFVTDGSNWTLFENLVGASTQYVMNGIGTDSIFLTETATGPRGTPLLYTEGISTLKLYQTTSGGAQSIVIGWFLDTPICEDSDGDGIPNSLDLDSDNDGIPDIVEAGGVDTNGDGQVDYPTAGIPASMVDVDNDGLADIVDDQDSGSGGSEVTSGTALANMDSDGDNIKDILDLDADNDGIPDLIEAGGIDTDGNGIVDVLTDADNDGFADLLDPSVNGSSTGTPIVATNGTGRLLDGVAGASLDADGDLLPDHLDLDTDNDGIPDIVEAGGIDTDGNGRVDAAYASDADNDGFADTYDSDDNTNPGINDGTGTPIVDTDGSGHLLDGQDASSLDTDGDGYADHLDLDADNDGIADLVEVGGVDASGAGTVDTGALPWDADGDGLADIYDQDASDGPSGTGTNGTALVKTTADIGMDGQVSVSGENMTPGGTNNVNMDGDTAPNHLDLDADNDGIVDLVEIGGTDSNNDGMVDDLSTNDTDNNGWLDAMNGTITTAADGADNNPYPDYTTGVGNPDFDGDGQPNYLDIDSDNDGIVDNTEGQSTSGYTAPTTDSDGDGINDAYEAGGTIGSFGGAGIDPENTDALDQDDYLDLDSDNDAESDLVEGHDSNNDGIADSGSTANTGLANGMDADFDGLDDGFDNLTSNPDPTNNALDPSDHPDTPDSGTADQDWRATNRNIAGVVWSDTDEDGILDSGESGISGAVVRVFNSSDVEVASVSTDSDGNYLVTDLPVGTYYVIFTTPPVHDTNSPIDAGGDDQVDSDANTSTGRTADYNITTGSAEIYTYAGFFGAPLPIELSSFGAYANDCDIQVIWQTVSEINADRFEIEHSTDGIRFNKIGQVRSTGGAFVQDYKFSHKDAQAVNYYRLKMMDLDGSYKYSQMIGFTSDCTASHGGLSQLYPNPVPHSDASLNLRFYTNEAETNLTITDLSGQVIQSLHLVTEKGWNTRQIDVRNLPQGIYFLSYQAIGKTHSLRFIKMKL